MEVVMPAEPSSLDYRYRMAFREHLRRSPLLSSVLGGLIVAAAVILERAAEFMLK
jgi:hypothetical protein